MAKKLIKREALNEFAAVYTKVVKQTLGSNQPYPKRASGKLIESFNIVIENQNGNDVIVIKAEPYYKFVDKGVSGTNSTTPTPTPTPTPTQP